MDTRIPIFEKNMKTKFGLICFLAVFFATITISVVASEEPQMKTIGIIGGVSWVS